MTLSGNLTTVHHRLQGDVLVRRDDDVLVLFDLADVEAAQVVQPVAIVVRNGDPETDTIAELTLLGSLLERLDPILVLLDPVVERANRQQDKRDFHDFQITLNSPVTSSVSSSSPTTLPV